MIRMIIQKCKATLKYRWLLSQLVGRDLKVKYKRSYLGFAWSLLNPLLMMAVMSIVFSKIFRYNVPNFPIYLLCGQVMFNYFSESTSMAMSSVIQGSELIKKVYIPKYILPLSKVISCTVNLLFSLVAVAIMMLITQTPVKLTILLVPIPILYLFFISFGLGLILSVLATKFRDTIYLYTVGLQALMYLTPIIYPVDILPEKILILIKFNPLYHIVDYFRQVVLYGTLPSIRDNLVCISFAVVSMLLGLYIFKKHQRSFLLYI